MGKEREVERIEYLLSALFLSESPRTYGVVGRVPDDWITEWLGLEPHRQFGLAALRHLAAVQLAPKAAISYDKSNPRPRWRLVEDFLRDTASLEPSDRERVARIVSSVLDRAALERGSQLVATDSAQACAICRLPFRSTATSVLTKDPFKPVWQAPEELCRPEVDHVVAISGLGEHTVDNLQVVCRACNLAKGSHLVVDPEAEIRFAGNVPEDIPRVHLLRLLQWLIQNRTARCSHCGSASDELTMRPAHPEASLTRTNLILTCYGCVFRSPAG
jgi:hypothetical protein